MSVSFFFPVKVILSIRSDFLFLNDKTNYIDTKKPFVIWQFVKIGVWVNFIIKEWKFCNIAHFFLGELFLQKNPALFTSQFYPICVDLGLE